LKARCLQPAVKSDKLDWVTTQGPSRMYVTEILERCSNFATRSARVYRSLAERFSGDVDRVHLWRELAFEEETHADILKRELQAFQEQDQAGNFLPDFAERLKVADRQLQALEQRAESANRLDDGLAVSVALEQTTLEDLYDDLILQGEPSFRLVTERLEAALTELPGTPAAAGMARRRRRPR
jgi:hypothetical protein